MKHVPGTQYFVREIHNSGALEYGTYGVAYVADSFEAIREIVREFVPSKTMSGLWERPDFKLEIAAVNLSDGTCSDFTEDFCQWIMLMDYEDATEDSNTFWSLFPDYEPDREPRAGHVFKRCGDEVFEVRA